MSDDFNTATTNRAAQLDALVGLAEGVAGADGYADMLGAVQLVELQVENVRRAIVAEARANGDTWKQLGDALGVTRSAVQQRYGTRKASNIAVLNWPVQPLDACAGGICGHCKQCEASRELANP